MSDELRSWAHVGAAAVVAAIGTEAWPATRAELVYLLARRGTVSDAGSHVDSMAGVLSARSGAERARYRDAALAYYQATFADVLSVHPVAAADIAVLVVRVMELLPGEVRQDMVQLNTADGHGHVHAVLSGEQHVYYHRHEAPNDVVVPTAAGAAAGAVGALAGKSASAQDTTVPVTGPTAGPSGAPAPDLTTGSPPPGKPPPAAGSAAGASKAAIAVKTGLAALLALGAAAAGTYAAVSVFGGGGGEDCSSVVAGRPPSVVLEEAGRRLDATSFAFTADRGVLRVTGTADMPGATVVFRQSAPGTPGVSGRIEAGVATLNGAAGVPADAVPGGVRPDGVFTDAAQPTAIAHELAKTQGVVRDGCTFEGSLASPGAGGLTAFKARIDGGGRLVSVTIDGPPARNAEYRDFGTTPSAGAGGNGATPGGRRASDAPTPDLSGTWRGTYVNDAPFTVSGPFAVRITQQGDKISGDLKLSGTGCALDGPIQGTLEGTQIRFGAVNGGQNVSFEGTVADGGLSGTYTTTCLNSTGTWTAKRSS